MEEQPELPRIVGLMMATITVVIAVSVVAGIGAAAFGGSLTDLGSGYGGLWGVPALLLTFVALIIGVAAAIKIGRALGPEVHRLQLAVLVLAGVWVIAIGYANVAHLVDPCVNGWWDANSRVGSQPLCERFGSELNWHTRFHLLAHAAPAAILLLPYLWAIRRWRIQDSAQPDRDEMANSLAAIMPARAERTGRLGQTRPARVSEAQRRC